MDVAGCGREDPADECVSLVDVLLDPGHRVTRQRRDGLLTLDPVLGDVSHRAVGEPLEDADRKPVRRLAGELGGAEDPGARRRIREPVNRSIECRSLSDATRVEHHIIVDSVIEDIAPLQEEGPLFG